MPALFEMGWILPAVCLSACDERGFAVRRLFLTSFFFSMLLILGFLVAKAQSGSYRLGLSSWVLLALILSWASLSLFSWWGLSSGRRTLIARIWLALLSCVVPYGVLDVVLGLVLIEKLSPAMQADEIVHHRLIPDSWSEMNTSEFQYTQRVNQLGLRGAEVTTEDSGQVCRILMLGDSFTMGKGVRDDQTFSVLLQDMLNSANPPGSRRVEVLNAGVDSYSPVLCLLRLRQLQPVVKPQVVVLNFDMSDLLQEQAYRKIASFDQNGDVIAVAGRAEDLSLVHPDGMRGVKAWIRQHLFVTRLLVHWLDQMNRAGKPVTVETVVETANPELLQHTLDPDALNREAQWDAVFDSFCRIRDYCSTHQIELVLTTYPWGHQVDESEWSLGRRAFLPDKFLVSDKSAIAVEKFAAEEGIRMVNAFEAFRRASRKKRLYFDRDMHWTAEGHRVMANELAVCLAPLVDQVLKSAHP